MGKGFGQAGGESRCPLAVDLSHRLPEFDAGPAMLRHDFDGSFARVDVVARPEVHAIHDAAVRADMIDTIEIHVAPSFRAKEGFAHIAIDQLNLAATLNLCRRGNGF